VDERETPASGGVDRQMSVRGELLDEHAQPLAQATR